MKNLIILSVLLLIAVSGYAQNISSSLFSEDAKAMKPVPSAFSAVDNQKQSSTGIEQASFSVMPVPAGVNGEVNDAARNSGTWKPVYDKSLKGVLVPAVPANDINVLFEYVPQEEESIVPEKAVEAL
ncbi:MAG: hypothetical protein L0Y76_09475 [Ignavibacteria bacterium]|nr:hypothetical protein [Ignavibacteria bacterium]